MAKQKHSGGGGNRCSSTDALQQLELKLSPPNLPVSASIIPFRTPRPPERTSSRDDALKRILDFAESLPGK